MASLALVGIATASFVLFQVWLQLTKATWSWAPRLAFLNNVFYSVANVVFFVYALKSFADAGLWEEIKAGRSWGVILENMFTKPLKPHASADFALAIYMYSKVWEFQDLIYVGLMGAPLNLHFRVHHVLTLSLGYVMFVFRTRSGALFCLANVFTHVFLYAYFGGARGPLMHSIVRLCGHLQLFVGIGFSMMGLCFKLRSGSLQTVDIAVSEGYPLFMSTVFLILLRMEIAEERKKSKRD